MVHNIEPYNLENMDNAPRMIDQNFSKKFYVRRLIEIVAVKGM